ncbi:MAG: EamA family transporter [Candidatus Rhabdochlamydia sp.]
MIASIVLGIAFVFTIVNRLYAKKTLNALDIYGVTILSNIFCTLVLLPYAIYKLPEIIRLPREQIGLILLLGILWSIIAWAMNASIALNDFSFKEIIRQTRVIFVVLGGVLIFGESLSILDTLGIGAIVVSTLIISWNKASLREHLTSKPILLAWMTSLLIAITTLLEKYLVMRVDVLTYTFLGAFALPTIILLLFFSEKRAVATKKLLLNHKVEIVLFSSFMLISFTAGLFAYKLLPISIAYPLIQSATVFAIVIGTALFEENYQWKRKLVAACTAIGGVLLIQI